MIIVHPGLQSKLNVRLELGSDQAADPRCCEPAPCKGGTIYSLIVLTTLDSGRVLLLAENLSCALTMSSYFGSVVIESFGTMCTIL
jgi:hypothetical protein